MSFCATFLNFYDRLVRIGSTRLSDPLKTSGSFSHELCTHLLATILSQSIQTQILILFRKFARTINAGEKGAW